MMKASLLTGSFTVEKQFAAPPARVFRAWSNPLEMPLWAAPSQDWTFVVERFEFRQGGTSLCRFGPRGEAPYVDVGRFDEIIQDRRIVSAYGISRGDQRISSSVSAFEFLAQSGGGTLLRVREMGLYLEGLDSGEGRRGGVVQQLEQLTQYLAND